VGDFHLYKHMLFYSVRHLDHRCRLMAWPTGALHSPETTEFKKRQIVWSLLCSYVIICNWNWILLLEVPCISMRGSAGPLFLDLGIRWILVASLTLWMPYPQARAPCGNGGSIHLRNVGLLLRDHTTLSHKGVIFASVRTWNLTSSKILHEPD
jgi:hypothetical protein